MSERGPGLARALKKHFGFTSFRPNQEPIIGAILDGRDVFAALPTGGGKSLCYQLPALVVDGLTVVVSPLIALMKDQVDAARENGLPAALLNSSLAPEQAAATWRDLSAGRVRLLYVSPERLSFADFRRALSGFRLARIAVDEAHCISEWGHEFRPDYRSLGLLRKEFPAIPIAAFTATATRHVQEDVIRLLALKDPLVVRASFDRPEIFYRVVPKDGDGEAQIREFVLGRPGQPGIIYRGTRKAAEATAASLSAAGVSAVAYHAGLADDARRGRQEAFIKDEVDVVVATIAFGMGIDKSNVRWVLHGELPRSVEGYYQETGRAARDGEDGETLLLHGPRDSALIRWHIGNMESPEERERAEARLWEIQRYAESGVCRRVRLLAHFEEAHPGACGKCDVCAGELTREDATESARTILSAAARTGERFGAHHLADVVCGILTDKVMERGHQGLPVFGSGRELDRSWWLSLVHDLEADGFLLRGDGKTAGLALSPRGRRLLQGRESFFTARRGVGAGEWVRPGTRAGARGGGAPSGAEAAATPMDGPAQEALFQCLKSVRRRIAQERGLPPYVVFSDKTLRAIAATRPTDPAGFLRCHGVGEKKLEAYGSEFLKAVREFVGTGGCS